MRNTSEKVAVDRLPSWIILRAHNYQTEEDAAVVVSWRRWHLQRIKEWLLRFRDWKNDHQDLQRLEADGYFSAYDSFDIHQWVDSRPVEMGDFYDESISLYDEDPPVDGWDELRVRAPHMVIRPKMVTWQFLTAHGDGHFESEPLHFDDKKIFGPYAT